MSGFSPSLRLLFDQGVPRDAVQPFRDAGMDAVHVAELGLSSAPDSQVLDHARRQGAVVITLDADFHMLLALSGAAAPSAIRIRIEGLRAEAFARLLTGVLARFASELHAGCLLTVKPRKTTCHRLPVGAAPLVEGR